MIDTLRVVCGYIAAAGFVMAGIAFLALCQIVRRHNKRVKELAQAAFHRSLGE